MYKLHRNYKPWTNAQSSEYGVVARTRHAVSVTYKKGKLSKIQQAQASAALTELKQLAETKRSQGLSA